MVLIKGTLRDTSEELAVLKQEMEQQTHAVEEEARLGEQVAVLTDTIDNKTQENIMLNEELCQVRGQYFTSNIYVYGEIESGLSS